MTVRDKLFTKVFIRSTLEHLIRYVKDDMTEKNLISHSTRNLSYENQELFDSDEKFNYSIERTLLSESFRMPKLYGLIGNFDSEKQFGEFLNNLGCRFELKMFYNPMKRYFGLKEVLNVSFSYEAGSVQLSIDRFV